MPGSGQSCRPRLSGKSRLVSCAYPSETNVSQVILPAEAEASWLGLPSHGRGFPPGMPPLRARVPSQNCWDEAEVSGFILAEVEASGYM